MGEMDYKSGSCELDEEKGLQEICVMNQISKLQQINSESDSFLVDMDSFSHSINKDASSPNSRITWQRSLTRKGSQREAEKTNNLNIDNQLLNATIPTSSPRGATTPQKPITPGPTDCSINSQIHHQITIAAAAATTTAAIESKLAARRLSFKRSSQSRIVDPRKILFYFATLSSMGSILLIYFTLSMRKLNGHDNGVDW